MRWDQRLREAAQGAKTAASRCGVKVGIVATGAVLAFGDIDRPVASPAPTLTERVVSSAPTPDAQPVNLVAIRAATADSQPKLDSGIQHRLIDKWIERLTASNSLQKSLDRMTKYEPMITTKLEARQMPRDLIYLAMIESNFDPKARSKARAVGLWQFMSPTARRFGLKVGSKVDERTNPSRSTDAALTYLSKLYDRFGSWYLAAAAYNSGEGTVSRALERVTGKTKGTDHDFFKIAPALPKETRDYVPKLIATTRIANNPEKYGLGD